MYLKYALVCVFFMWTLVLAKPLGASIRNVSADTQTDHFYSLSLSNDSITSSDVTGGRNIDIQCDGSTYGYDLDIVDCEEAKAYIGADSDEVQWAERHTGWQKQTSPLPYRSMGDKAKCYVEAILTEGATSAKASTNQVRNAAVAIRHHCASGGKLQGGIATNIGGDNKLAVIVGSYNPPSTVQCRGLLLPLESCEDILDGMPVTTAVDTFGAGAAARYPLPYGLESEDKHCLLRILGVSSASPSDSASWYEMWEATIAIWSVCARHARGGSVSGIGDHGSLLLVMTAGAAGANSNTTIRLVDSEDSSGGIISTANPVTNLSRAGDLYSDAYPAGYKGSMYLRPAQRLVAGNAGGLTGKGGKYALSERFRK